VCVCVYVCVCMCVYVQSISDSVYKCIINIIKISIRVCNGY